MPQAKARELAAAIKKLFDLRDEAVHPKADARETILHPAIGVGVERRMRIFNYDVAKWTVEAVQNILIVLAQRPKPQFQGLVSYCSHLSVEVAPLRGGEAGSR